MSRFDDDSRYEFRVWNPSDEIGVRFRSRGRHTGRSTVRDCYILAHHPEVNAKIRRDTLEVKRLLECQVGLERWRHDWEARAPFTTEVVERLFAEFGLACPVAGRRSISVDRLVSELHGHDHLGAAWVTKGREFFNVGEVSGEVTELTIDDRSRRLSTIVLEGPDADAVDAEREKLEMESMENIAVHQAVRQAVRAGGD